MRGAFATSDAQAPSSFQLLTLGIASIIVPILVIAVLTATLFSLPGDDLPPERRPRPGITRIYAADGSQIAALHAFETYIPVAHADIPRSLKDAVVAVEDARFFSHRGVDARAVARAVWTNLLRGRAVEGGSTITQQYVKQAFMGDKERSLMTKAREAALAVRVERALSKDEILHRYLLTVYFGGGAYGVGAAAAAYFRKPVRELTLSEAALLAAVIRAPTALNPRANPIGAEHRRRLVLRLMREQGHIGPIEYEAALEERVVVSGEDEGDGSPTTRVYPARNDEGRYPYFVDYVRRYLVARYGEDRVLHGGLRVETSVDPRLQQLAEEAVSDGLAGTEPPVDMALVSVDPRTGLVRALVGGRDFDQSQVNLALGGCRDATDDGDEPCLGGGGTGRQPGSSFKVFVLARALEEGMPLSRTYRAPARYRFPHCRGAGCTVQNAGGGGYGTLTLQRALAYSVNTVFAQLVEDIGVEDTAHLARRLGITTIGRQGKDAGGEPYGPGLALGTAEVSPLDMASAYGVIANRGVRLPASPVMKVTSANGQVLEDNTARRSRRVLSAAVADQVTDALRDVIEYGTGKEASIDVPGVVGKTGTSENYGDAWFVGFAPELSTAVWMGYSDARRPLVDVGGRARVYGGTIPAETWAAFMSAALARGDDACATPACAA